MQRLALLLRRPAIPVPSVLLTATLMCVTSTPPSSPVLHLLYLISPSLQHCLPLPLLMVVVVGGLMGDLLMCIYVATLS